ncbi:MAG: glycosyltransferase, partial [Gammaproteobacteria bacterium]
LLKQLGANDSESCCEKPLVGFVGRLVFQKGIDLLLNAIETLLPKHQACFAIIGSGELELEEHLTNLTRQHPNRVFSYIGYSESLAHQLEAGADVFAMPSRYEPCGLNQLYSLRYGTPPVVRNTGGLADTVIQTNAESLKNNTATGFLFDEPSAQILADTISYALSYYDNKAVWQSLVKNCMKQDFSWDHSAAAYLELFDQT